MYIENILAISELNILKRLKIIETMLELNDYSGTQVIIKSMCFILI
jgi:hypothetical protein